MQIFKLLISEKVTNAKFALKQATCENIIALCREYLQMLNEHRDELYKLRGTAEINSFPSSSLARELIEQTRRVIRNEVVLTTREYDETEFLLKSFTSISGYEAVQTFNQLEYKGFTEWELRANEVRLKNDDNGEKLTIQTAIEIASELRRKAYIVYKATFLTNLKR